jgi:hypothetical protein
MIVDEHVGRVVEFEELLTLMNIMHVRRTERDHDVRSSLLHIEVKGHIFSMCHQPKRSRAGFGGVRA